MQGGKIITPKNKARKRLSKFFRKRIPTREKKLQRISNEIKRHSLGNVSKIL